MLQNYHIVPLLCLYFHLKYAFLSISYLVECFFWLNLLLKVSQKIPLFLTELLSLKYALWYVYKHSYLWSQKKQLCHIYFQSASFPLIISWRVFAETKMSEKWQSPHLPLWSFTKVTQSKPKLKIIFIFHIFVFL